MGCTKKRENNEQDRVCNGSAHSTPPGGMERYCIDEKMEAKWAKALMRKITIT